MIGHRKKHARGFAMVEVALALFVTAVGILAAFTLITRSADQRHRAAAETRSALLASDILNTIRSHANLAQGEAQWDEF